MTLLYQFYFYVPEQYAESVKEACFAAGAGAIGDYRRCSWQTPGTGQFEPQEAAQPFLGQRGTLSREPEIKVEMVLSPELAEKVITALKTAHPYEEPAYGFIEIQTEFQKE